jgi:hypothetical protein
MRGERALWAALVLAGLAVRLAFAAVVPPLQAPDERAHLRYVEFVAREGALPVQPPRDIQRDVAFWPQYYQPPLAYALFAPLERALRSAGADEATRLRALRAQNALYGAATVLVGLLVMARLTPPGDPRRLLAGLVLALWPGFAGNAAALNNDALANLLAAALWLPLLAPSRPRSPWLAGVLFGLALNAKLTALVLAPLLWLVPWLVRRDEPRGALRFAAVAGGIAAGLLAPWLARNVVVYGDPLAIAFGSISFEWLATQLPPEQVAALAAPRPARVLGVFFGQFGIYLNLRWTPVFVGLVPLTAIAALGWLRRSAAAGDAVLSARAPALLAAVVLAAAGLAWFSLRYYGGWQGRYLYTVMVPLAALLAAGWARWQPARPGWALAAMLAGLLLALDAGLVWKLHDFFTALGPARWGLGTWL